MACINVEDPTIDVNDIETYRLAFLMQFFVQHKPRFRFPKLRLQDIYQRVIKDCEPTAFCDLVARILRFLGNGDAEVCIDRVDQALDRFTVDKRTSYRIQVQRDRNGKPVHQLGPAARASLLYNLIESIYDEQPDFSFTSGFNAPGTNNGVPNPASLRGSTSTTGLVDPTSGDMTGVGGPDDLISEGMAPAIPDFTDADITIKAGQDAQGFSYYYMDDLRLYRERPHSGISSQWDVAVGPTTSQWQTFITSLSRNEKDNDLYYFLKNELFELVRVSLESYELELDNPELTTDYLRSKEASELQELRQHKAGPNLCKSSAGRLKLDSGVDSSSGKVALTPVSGSASLLSSAATGGAGAAAGGGGGGGGGLTTITGPKSASPSFSGGHGGSATTPLTPGTARTPTSAPPVCASHQQTSAPDISGLFDVMPPAGIKSSQPSPTEAKPVDFQLGHLKGYTSSSTSGNFDEASPTTMQPSQATPSGILHSDTVFSGPQKMEYPGVPNRYSPRATGNPSGSMHALPTARDSCDSLGWPQRQLSSTSSSVPAMAVPPPAYSGHQVSLQAPASPSQMKVSTGKPPPPQFLSDAVGAGPVGLMEHMGGGGAGTQTPMPMATGDQAQPGMVTTAAVGSVLQHTELGTKLVGGPLTSGTDGAPLTQEQLENRKSKLAQLEKINSTLSKSKSASTPGATAAFALQQQQQQQRMQLQQQQQLVVPIQATGMPPCCQAQTPGQLPPGTYTSSQQNLPPMGNFPVRPSAPPLGYRIPGNDPTGQREWDRVCCPDYQREKIGDLVCAPPRMPSSVCLRGLPESTAMTPGSAHLEYPSSTMPPLASTYAGAANSVMISSTPMIMEPTPGCYQIAGPQALPQYTSSPAGAMPGHADATGSVPPVVMVPPNNSNLTSPGPYHPQHMTTVPNNGGLPIQQGTVMKQAPQGRPTAAAAVVTDQQHFSGQKRAYYPPGNGQLAGEGQWVHSGVNLPSAGVDMFTPPGCYRFPSNSAALSSVNPITSVPRTTATVAPVANSRGTTAGGSKSSKKRKTATARSSGTPAIGGGVGAPLSTMSGGPPNGKSTATPAFNQGKLTAPVGNNFPQTGYHHPQQQQHMLRRPSHYNPMYSCQPVLPGQQHPAYHSTDPYLMTTNNSPVYQDMMGVTNGPIGLMPETRRSVTPKGCADSYALAPCTSMRGPLKSYVSGVAGTNIPVSSAYLMNSDAITGGGGGQDIPGNLRSNQSGSPNTQNLTSTCLANLARLSQMSGPEAPHMGPTGTSSSLPASYANRANSSGGGGAPGIPQSMMATSNYSGGQLPPDTRGKQTMATAAAAMHMAEPTESGLPTASSTKYLPPTSGYPGGPAPLPQQQQQQPPPSIQVNNTFFNAQLNVQQMNYQNVSAPGSTGQMQIHFVQQQQQQQQAHDARTNPRTAGPTDAPGGGLRTPSSEFYSPEVPASCHRISGGGGASNSSSGGYYALQETHQMPVKMSETNGASASTLLPTSAAPGLSNPANTMGSMTNAAVTAVSASIANPVSYGNTSVQIMPRTPHTIQYLPTVNSSSEVGGNNAGFHQHQQLSSAELPPNNNNPALRTQQQPPSYPHQMYYNHSQQQQVLPSSASIYSQQQQHHLSAANKPVYPMTGNPAGGRAGAVGAVGSWPPGNESIPFEANHYHSQQQQQIHHYSHHHHQQQQHEMAFQSVVDGSTVTNGRSSQLVSNGAGAKPIPQTINYGPSQTYSANTASMDLMETGVVSDRVGLAPVAGDAGPHRTSVQQQQYFRQTAAGRIPVMYEQAAGYARGRPPQQQQMYISNTASSTSSSHASMTSNYQLNPDGHVQFMMSASNSSSSSSSMTTTGPGPLINCAVPPQQQPPPTAESEFMPGSMRLKSDQPLPGQRGDETRPGASPAGGGGLSGTYRHHSAVGATFGGRVTAHNTTGRLSASTPTDWPSHIPSAALMDISCVGGPADGAGLADIPQYPAAFGGQAGTGGGMGGGVAGGGRVGAGGELMLQHPLTPATGQPQPSILCDNMHFQPQQAAQSQVYPLPAPTVAQQQ